MNLDQNYNRRVRIIGKPGDVRPYNITVQDIETGEDINNVFRATIFLDAQELSVAQLSYWETNEAGNLLVGDDDKVIEHTITTQNPEVDITVLERS